jgi:hypothetical protein
MLHAALAGVLARLDAGTLMRCTPSEAAFAADFDRATVGVSGVLVGGRRRGLLDLGLRLACVLSRVLTCSILGAWTTVGYPTPAATPPGIVRELEARSAALGRLLAFVPAARPRDPSSGLVPVEMISRRKGGRGLHVWRAASSAFHCRARLASPARRSPFAEHAWLRTGAARWSWTRRASRTSRASSLTAPTWAPSCVSAACGAAAGWTRRCLTGVSWTRRASTRCARRRTRRLSAPAAPPRAPCAACAACCAAWTSAAPLPAGRAPPSQPCVRAGSSAGGSAAAQAVPQPRRRFHAAVRRRLHTLADSCGRVCNCCAQVSVDPPPRPMLIRELFRAPMPGARSHGVAATSLGRNTRVASHAAAAPRAELTELDLSLPPHVPLHAAMLLAAGETDDEAVQAAARDAGAAAATMPALRVLRLINGAFFNGDCLPQLFVRGAAPRAPRAPCAPARRIPGADAPTLLPASLSPARADGVPRAGGAVPGGHAAAGGARAAAPGAARAAREPAGRRAAARRSGRRVRRVRAAAAARPARLLPRAAHAAAHHGGCVRPRRARSCMLAAAACSRRAGRLRLLQSGTPT